MSTGRQQFGRIVEVTAGKSTGGVTRTWSDLAIKFECERSDKKKPSPGKVTLYNLDDESRGLLSGDDAQISVSAGYRTAGGPARLFSGDLQSVKHAYDSKEAEWVTELEARDGGTLWDTGAVSESFADGASSSDVLKRIAVSLGVALRLAPGLPEVTFPDGLMVAGLVRTSLSRVCEAAGLEWSLQDGELVVTPQGGAVGGQVFLIDSTQILSVERMERKKGGKGQKGLKVKVNLNPLISPKDTLQLESKTESGLWVVRKVKHTGETWSDTFESELELTAA